MEKRYLTAGRVKNIRDLGNIIFVDIYRDNNLIQGVFKKELLENQFKNAREISISDIIRIEGQKTSSQKRQNSIDVNKYQILSKNISSSNKKLDLNLFSIKNRSEILYWTRDFLRNQNFLEVDIPILHLGKIPSSSREFVTSHVTLNHELYLRKSMDLFLRRLSVNDLDKVYSIGNNFRNEYITKDKLPEFTMLTLIQNYSSLEEIMILSENLLKFVSRKINPESVLNSKDRYLLKEYTKFIEGFRQEEHPYNSAKRVQIEPLFIYNLPFNKNSLAKRNKKGYMEEFKLIVDSTTIIHGYNEIFDYNELKRRLLDQRVSLEVSELKDLINEIKGGAPLATSFGLSIDRLSAILSGTKDVKETIPFPFSRLEKLR